MGLETSGATANSWQTIVQANQFLTDFVHPLLGISPELSDGDEPYLIESAKEISRMWSFKGQPFLSHAALEHRHGNHRNASALLALSEPS